MNIRKETKTVYTLELSEKELCLICACVGKVRPNDIEEWIGDYYKCLDYKRTDIFGQYTTVDMIYDVMCKELGAKKNK